MSNKPAVLVVEDKPQVRATAVSIIRALGRIVFEAYNGYQALELLEEHGEIRVLFADVRMPGMTGVELVQKAQLLRPDLHVVLTSGYVGREGVPDDVTFVPKPWRLDEVAQAVHC